MSAVSKGSKLIAKTNAKLPKLILGPFGGDPSEFHSFCKSSVHENSSLSGVDKINHLKSLCQGQGALRISGFSITAANYSAAVKCLIERFGDTSVIVSHHMDSFVNLVQKTGSSEPPPVTPARPKSSYKNKIPVIISDVVKKFQNWRQIMGELRQYHPSLKVSSIKEI